MTLQSLAAKKRRRHGVNGCCNHQLTTTQHFDPPPRSTDASHSVLTYVEKKSQFGTKNSTSSTCIQVNFPSFRGKHLFWIFFWPHRYYAGRLLSTQVLKSISSSTLSHSTALPGYKQDSKLAATEKTKMMGLFNNKLFKAIIRCFKLGFLGTGDITSEEQFRIYTST